MLTNQLDSGIIKVQQDKKQLEKKRGERIGEQPMQTREEN